LQWDSSPFIRAIRVIRGQISLLLSPDSHQ
jgi:hypothetical protein